jgi:hypothetical protein
LSIRKQPADKAREEAPSNEEAQGNEETQAMKEALPQRQDVELGTRDMAEAPEEAEEAEDDEADENILSPSCENANEGSNQGD